MPEVSVAVRRETLWVAAWTVGLCFVMHLLFALIGLWNWTVLTGSLLGCATAVGNFFWMAMRVQAAVGKPEKDAKRILQSSQTMRLLLQAGVMALGFAVSFFDGWAVLIPLLFPHIAVRLRPLWKKGMAADPEALEKRTDGPEDGADTGEGSGNSNAKEGGDVLD